MIPQILSHTPAWVFALFIALLVVGVKQAKTRSVAVVPALALPAGMTALSLAGIASSFGLRPVPLACWAAGLVAAALAGFRLVRRNGVQYQGPERRFLVAGSWTPLAVIMAIFFSKYAYAVLRALDAGLVTEPSFVAGMSAVYGLFSGYFVARALNMLRVMHPRTQAQPA